MTLYVMPDAGEVARAYLLGLPEIGAFFDDRISSIVDTTWPSIRLTTLSQVEQVERRLDRALVQADIFAAPADAADPDSGWAKAHDGAQLVRAALRDIAGYVHPGAVAVGADTIGMRENPDESRTPPAPCWTVTAPIYLRPDP